MFKKGTSFNVLYTTSIDKTHEFYKNLGLEIKQLEADKVVVSIGDFDLHFILSSSEPFEEYKYITKPEYGQGMIFYIETDDIDKVQEEVEKAGGNLRGLGVFENKWDALEMLFEDPNGYKFAIYQEK